MEVLGTMNYIINLKKSSFLLILIVFLLSVSYSDNSKGVYLDYTNYYFSEDKNQIDLSFRLDNSNLAFEFNQSDSLYYAEFYAYVNVYNERSETVYSDSFKQKIAVKDIQQTNKKEMFVIDNYTLYVPPGFYTFEMKFVDMKSNNEYTVSDSGKIFSKKMEDKIVLSDLKLALMVRPQTKSDKKFVKHNKYVLPHPAAVFGNVYPNLYFYYELYNFAYSKNDTMPLMENIIILDESDKVYQVFKTNELTNKPAMSIEGHLEVSEMPVGKYTLKITVTDMNNRNVALAKEDFLIEKDPEFEKKKQKIELNDEDIEFSNDIIPLIGSEKEKKVFEDLDAEAKKNFIIRFWKTRDTENAPTNKRVRNANYYEFKKRYDYSNNHFSSFNPGWKTDRGEIWIRFGEPDETVRKPHAIITKPYEIWIYFNQGGRKFVFVDEGGYGDYDLVYDTEYPERYDSQYEVLLYDQ